MPKPRELDVQTRLIYHDRVVKVGPGGKLRSSPGKSAKETERSGGGDSLRVVRHVVQAVSAINGEVRPSAASLRPEVALLVAEKRDRGWPVVVFSPAGPLSWSELELVQGVGDPLALADLLPEGPVAIGDHWNVREPAAKAVSGYDVITSSNFLATLESADSKKARIRLKGRIEGSAFGGIGVIGCDGFASFDRELGRIERLDLNRVENRQPGPVEAGLDLKSTLSVARNTAPLAEELSDLALANVSLDASPQSEMLRMAAPGGRECALPTARGIFTGKTPRWRSGSAWKPDGSSPSAISWSGRPRPRGGTRIPPSSAKTSAVGSRIASSSSWAPVKSAAIPTAASATAWECKGAKATWA